MPSYRILHNSDLFDIRPWRPRLASLALMEGVLFWERDGLIGKIDNATLTAQLMIYDSYKQMQQRGRIVDLPAAAYELSWEQTIEHRPVSGEKLTQPLRLDVVPTEGQGGDDTGVPH